MNKIIISSLSVLLAAFGAPGSATAQTFNVNNAFLDNESPNGFETNPFAAAAGGTITLGYNVAPSDPAQFVTTGLNHTDAFNGTANAEGYFIPNNVIVPALLINSSGAPLTFSFGVTLGPDQILLHPGNPGPDGFAQPPSAAVLRYRAPSTATYTITGEFASIHGGIVGVDILRNGVSILSSGAGSDATPFNETTSLTAGDFLDFVVDAQGDIGADSTGLYANIVPEPASVGFLALGGLAMLARRQR